MLNSQIRMEKNGEEIKFFSHNSQEMKKYNILKQSIIHTLPLDFEAVGYVYRNQFIVTEILKSGEFSFENGQNSEILEIIIEGFDIENSSSPICLMNNKKICSDCKNFPCSCEEKSREDKYMNIPLFMLSEEDKIILSQKSDELNSNIAIELAKDESNKVRKSILKNTDKEILLQKAVSNLQAGNESIEVVLSVIENSKIPGFLITKFWDISKDDLINCHRDSIIDIIKHDNLVDNLADKIYEYLKEKNVTLTSDEKKALVLSSETNLENKKEIRDNYSGDSLSKAVIDKAISEYEQKSEAEQLAQRRIEKVQEQERVDEDGWAEGTSAGGMVKTKRGPGVKEISGNELEDYMKKMGVYPNGEDEDDGWPI
jgi:hypothetical protein